MNIRGGQLRIQRGILQNEINEQTPLDENSYSLGLGKLILPERINEMVNFLNIFCDIPKCMSHSISLTPLP